MQKRMLALAAGILLFIVAVIIMLAVGIHRESKVEEYTDRETRALPTVSFICEGMSADPLFGFADRDDSVAYARTLLPSTDGTLEICYSDIANLSSAKLYLESEDRERLIDETGLEFYRRHGAYRSSYDISVMVAEGERYFLTVKVDTKDGKTGYYTTKLCIVTDEDLKTKKELIDLAESFSKATLSKDTEAIAEYLKYDEAKAGKDLSFVNLSSARSLITWAGLRPKAGEKTLVIYEWGLEQIGIALCYDVSSVYGSENNDYNVKECFTLRKRGEKYFILDYERFTGQKFDARSDEIGNTSILLGVQPDGSMQAISGKDQDLFFVADGGVWHFDVSENMLVNVYGNDTDYYDGGRYPYDIKLSGVNNGKLYFTVLGYMGSGKNEGKNGISLYEYDPEEKNVRIKMTSLAKGDIADIREGNDRISYLSKDMLFTVDVGEGLYSMDLTGKDIICLMKDMVPESIKLDESGGMAAWQIEGEPYAIYFINLETGDIDTIKKDRDIKLLGFIKNDIIYAVASDEKWEECGFTVKELFESVVVSGMDKEEKLSYKNEGGMLTDISLGANSITFGLCKKGENGFYIEGNDALNMASPQNAGTSSIIMIATSEAKRNYYYITLPQSTNKAKVYSSGSAKYSLEGAAELFADAAKSEAGYEAISYGKRIAKSESPATAMKAVFDSFGTVTYNGSRIWDRDARTLYLTLNLPKMVWTEEGHEQEMAAMSSLERGVDIFVHAGVLSGEIEQADAKEREKGNSICEELKGVYKERLVALGRCDYQYLLYYINKKHPVLALCNDNTSLLVTGYTSTKLTIYDPADRTTTSYENEEADALFKKLECFFVSYV